MNWVQVETADGSFTLENVRLGQACHSIDGAWTEARERYAAACRIAERAGGSGRVRVMDVGTGLGLNIAAALEALERSGGADVELDVCTFEIDEEVLDQTRRLFLERTWPAELERRWRVVLATLDEARRGRGAARASVPWSNGRRGGLRLFLGDARETIDELEVSLRFDAIFLDPFSPAADPPLWEPAFLARVAERLATHGRLSTYTASLAVRAALVAAGLRVGPGERCGTKCEGTLAGREGDLPSFAPTRARKIERRARRLAAEFET